MLRICTIVVLALIYYFAALALGILTAQQDLSEIPELQFQSGYR